MRIVIQADKAKRIVISEPTEFSRDGWISSINGKAATIKCRTGGSLAGRAIYLSEEGDKFEWILGEDEYGYKVLVYARKVNQKSA